MIAICLTIILMIIVVTVFVWLATVPFQLNYYSFLYSNIKNNFQLSSIELSKRHQSFTINTTQHTLRLHYIDYYFLIFCISIYIYIYISFFQFITIIIIINITSLRLQFSAHIYVPETSSPSVAVVKAKHLLFLSLL